MIDLQYIIEQCLKKSEKGYELFFKQYYSFIYRVCYIYVNDNAICKDIVQDTFIKIFNRLHEFQPEKGRIEFWLRKIAVNQSLDYIRSKNRHQIVSIDTERQISGYKFNDSIDKLDLNIVLVVIDQLKHPLREVILLNCIEGYSHKEISELLSISEENSRYILSEARKVLKKYFQYDKEIFRN